MRSTPSGRVIGAGLAAVTLTGAATLAVTMSPAANATVDTISVSDTAPVVGGSYTLYADLSGASIGLLVNWNDNGQSLTKGVGIIPWPVGHSSVTWQPTTPGQHIITASQGSSTQTLILNVTDGSGTTTTTAPPTTTTAPPTTTTTPPTGTPTTTQPTTSQPSNGGSGSGSGSGGTGSATGSAGTLVGALLRGLFGSS
ncbi:hypothetical protein VMT65_00540 [Nocardia sp. CDC153]|uniref:hypothetical protein n=1 Tax=Nocardia sp. CDC153 TaxID=3112167 RepID=UPI002DBA98C8|nr:hypothetical protein [Nocardia sp. CDC153]MEC3951509.1 hypothetical protein [Nocardia sp. CDC153]